jgi:hypothetical protein
MAEAEVTEKSLIDSEKWSEFLAGFKASDSDAERFRYVITALQLRGYYLDIPVNTPKLLVETDFSLTLYVQGLPPITISENPENDRLSIKVG